MHSHREALSNTLRPLIQSSLFARNEAEKIEVTKYKYDVTDVTLHISLRVSRFVNSAMAHGRSTQ